MAKSKHTSQKRKPKRDTALQEQAEPRSSTKHDRDRASAGRIYWVPFVDLYPSFIEAGWGREMASPEQRADDETAGGPIRKDSLNEVLAALQELEDEAKAPVIDTPRKLSVLCKTAIRYLGSVADWQEDPLYQPLHMAEYRPAPLLRAIWRLMPSMPGGDKPQLPTGDLRAHDAIAALYGVAQWCDDAQKKTEVTNAASGKSTRPSNAKQEETEKSEDLLLERSESNEFDSITSMGESIGMKRPTLSKKLTRERKRRECKA